jgi:hypothetical protein
MDRLGAAQSLALIVLVRPASLTLNGNVGFPNNLSLERTARLTTLFGQGLRFAILCKIFPARGISSFTAPKIAVPHRLARTPLPAQDSHSQRYMARWVYATATVAIPASNRDRVCKYAYPNIATSHVVRALPD